MMLTSVLTPEARERLQRVALVKADTARAVEDYILRMARAGKISAKARDSQAAGTLCVYVCVCEWPAPVVCWWCRRPHVAHSVLPPACPSHADNGG